MTFDPGKFLSSRVNCLDALRGLDEGVVIVDASGRIVFMNETDSRIEGVEERDALGKRPPDIWDVTEETSVLLQCLRAGRPLLNIPMATRTSSGRVVNIVNSAYPLRNGDDLVGAILFVREYNMMQEAITSLALRAREVPRRPAGTGAVFFFFDLIGTDPVFQESVRTARSAAATASPVMICGETGTGKELFAQAVHNHGPRRERPYVALNCAAIPENLLEGILFGTSRGAFTGAIERQGLFERASGGTLFLDEINSMPLGLQAKLLRVIQERRVRRVGSLEETEIDVKVLSSVNEDPYRALEGGKLRKDLYYRLGVVQVHIPPLRERPADLPLLTRHFIGRYNGELGVRIEGVSPEVERMFRAHSWPGNVRELQHVIEGAMTVLADRRTAILDVLPRHALGISEPAHAPAKLPPENAGKENLARRPGEMGRVPPWSAIGEGAGPDARSLVETQARLEREAILSALSETGGNVAAAGRLLGISRQRLAYRMKKHAITP